MKAMKNHSFCIDVICNFSRERPPRFLQARRKTSLRIQCNKLGFLDFCARQHSKCVNVAVKMWVCGHLHPFPLGQDPRPHQASPPNGLRLPTLLQLCLSAGSMQVHCCSGPNPQFVTHDACQGVLGHHMCWLKFCTPEYFADG